MTPDPNQRRVLSAGSLIGARVRNSEGEDLGRIEEILVDVSSGRVAYALIASGGVMGIGEKLFAVPWDAFTGARDGEVLIDADRPRLEGAARFDPIRWHDPADPAWVAHLDEFYGVAQPLRH